MGSPAQQGVWVTHGSSGGASQTRGDAWGALWLWLMVGRPRHGGPGASQRHAWLHGGKASTCAHVERRAITGGEGHDPCKSAGRLTYAYRERKASGEGKGHPHKRLPGGLP